MQLGKLNNQGSLNAVAPGELVFIADQLLKRRYLIDTGAFLINSQVRFKLEVFFANSLS